MFCAQGKTNNELAKWFLLRLAVLVCLSPIVINGQLNAQDAVDKTTLYGKFMCGYQGWFRAPGDGSEKGWVHWFRGNVPPAANLQVDLFPDPGEFDPDELFDTNMHYGNGSVVKLYSACIEKTVLRHFQWMQDYNIDGVWVQRFGSPHHGLNESTNRVLLNCRKGAETYGRVFVVM